MPDVPSRSAYDPVLDAVLHTGDEAVGAVIELEHAAAPHSLPVAFDIETPGFNTVTVNCVTAAWVGPTDGRVHTILLDPARDPVHVAALDGVLSRAGSLIAHNAPFDVPILAHHGWMDRADIDRVTDTLVLARLAEPDTFTGKKLSDLTGRHLGLGQLAGGMETAFRAAGYKTRDAGYEGMDIGSPIYRMGAMADTVATLRLEPLLRRAARDRLTSHPFAGFGATDEAGADAIIAAPEICNRVGLRRSAAGLAVDLDYLDAYGERIERDRAAAERELAQAGLRGGSGQAQALIAYLADHGELPPDWPLTPTGRPRATKDDLDALDHPLATAQRTLAATDKVLGYLGKVARQAELTGSCHPQLAILGASQTGRMAYSHPELHQFSTDARPIITGDHGLTSIDWAQIEPVTMALMAGDEAFLAPFEAGADLYEPIQRSAGVSRSVAKTVLLAAMYGQGVASLARRIGHTAESASQVRRQMFGAMPACARWMSKVQRVAETHGVVITAAGRILPVHERAPHKSVNYVVQGSAADVLMAAVVEMERRGIGDHFQIAMHDELVVDTAVAAEVEEIMRTPPPFLTRWAGRTPVLRTDRSDMGSRWLKV